MPPPPPPPGSTLPDLEASTGFESMRAGPRRIASPEGGHKKLWSEPEKEGKKEEMAGAKTHSAMHTDNTAYSTGAQVAWLMFWFFNNIGVTLLNKAAFSSVNFNYPCTLSAVHMACNTVGAYAYLQTSGTKQKAIDGRGQLLILAFSVVFAANIAIGNVSLRYVSVNFNQVMRSLVPAIVMAIDCLRGKRFSQGKVFAVIPIVGGVAAATYGDLSFTAIGFFMTVLCVILAALKVMVSGSILTGDYKLEAFDLLSRMAPLSFMWMMMAAWVAGEIDEIQASWIELTSGYAFHVVIFSGFLSVSLNIASFMANKVTSPLTLTIASNVKQVLLILVATIIFATPVSFLNGAGIAIVIAGSAQYSLVTTREKAAAAERLRAESNDYQQEPSRA